MPRHDSKRVMERRTVTNTPWYVSYMTGSGIDGAKLSVHRTGPRGQLVRGEGDGRMFRSVEAASKYALEHGYLKLYEPKRHFEGYVSPRAQYGAGIEKCPSCTYRSTPYSVERHREQKGH